MKTGLLQKVRFSSVAQIFSVLAPKGDVSNIISTDRTAAELIVTLIDRELYVDAIRYLAVALPRREAVWWACVVGQTMLGDVTTADSPEGTAWKAAENWVYDPTEMRRQAAYPAANTLGFNTAGAYAALGAFWSGGSLTPPGAEQVVPPGEALTGSAVSASIMLSCVPGATKEIDNRHMASLVIGVDITNGGNGLHVSLAEKD